MPKSFQASTGKLPASLGNGQAAELARRGASPVGGAPGQASGKPVGSAGQDDRHEPPDPTRFYRRGPVDPKHPDPALEQARHELDQQLADRVHARRDTGPYRDATKPDPRGRR